MKKAMEKAEQQAETPAATSCPTFTIRADRTAREWIRSGFAGGIVSLTRFVDYGADNPRLVVDLADVVAPEGRLKRVPLAILGAWIKGKQKFAITRQVMAEIVANFRKRQADTVVDYEHASEFPEAAQGQPIPAAGWLKSIADGPDEAGVLYGFVEFTQRAARMIAGGEYRYFSPVINYGARDKRTGAAQGATLDSLALTHRPFLDAMPAVMLSDRARGGLMAPAAVDSMTAEEKKAELDRIDDEIKRLALEKMKESPALPYYGAVKEVAREHPELDRQRSAVYLSGSAKPAIAYSDGWATEGSGDGALTVKPAKTLTVESAKTELQDLKLQWFAEIGKLMGEGLSHLDAVCKLNNENQDFMNRERQLLDFVKRAEASDQAELMTLSASGRGRNISMTAEEKKAELDRIADEINRLAREKMKESPAPPYHGAVKEVAREHPELVRQRSAALHSGRG